MEITTDLEPLEQGLDQLRYTVQDLRDDHDRLGQRVQEIDFRHTDQDQRIEHLRGQLDDKMAEHAESLARTQAVANRLIARLDWLEHHVRAAANPHRARLDQADSRLRELAAKVRKGHHASSRLLPPSRRTYLETYVRQYQQRYTEHLEHVAAALRESRTLANTRPGDNSRASAAQTFGQARQRASTIANQLKRDRDTYNSARRELATDDQLQETNGPTIHAGQQARATLQARMRKRLSTAIAQRHVLPAWFATALGYGPPADRTVSWLDLAANVIAYRITYAVTDPVLALGSREPTNDDEPARLQWHQQLTRALQDLQQ